MGGGTRVNGWWRIIAEGGGEGEDACVFVRGAYVGAGELG